jgi:hypothetical protein
VAAAKNNLRYPKLQYIIFTKLSRHFGASAAFACCDQPKGRPMKEKKGLPRLAQMLIHRQKQLEATDRAICEEYGWLQQTYNNWKGGAAPRSPWYDSVASYLGVTPHDVEELAEEAKISKGSRKIPKLSVYSAAREYGEVKDASTGEYFFNAFNVGRRHIPEGRYAFIVDTAVMEPSLRQGTRAFADGSIWAKPGNEVMVHADNGEAWLGELVSMKDGGVQIRQYNPDRTFSLKEINAVHPVVLSERI